MDAQPAKRRSLFGINHENKNTTHTTETVTRILALFRRSR
jgi:hypothetical protein